MLIKEAPSVENKYPPLSGKTPLRRAKRGVPKHSGSRAQTARNKHCGTTDESEAEEAKK